jgi:antitoxin (DNA-binding transcriptional repressor) of toxin-antitoxin stability system
MKTLTTRDLNRHTARVLDSLERGESFEIRRNGHAVGYLTQTAPTPERKPDWKAHFDWLRRQSTKNDAKVLKEFEGSRRRLAAREKAMGNLS